MERFGPHPIISNQITKKELAVILRELQTVLEREVEGDVVEFGCYEGTTALFVQRALLARGAKKTLHVYDSFEGLPPKSAQDASPAGSQFQAGELAASKAALVRHFRQAGLELPVIHKSWFAKLSPADLPPRICFAFLDGDFYHSIRDSLNHVWPRLSPGAVVAIDDYQTESLPGVRRAVQERSRTHTFSVQVEASLAILRLQDR